MWAAFDVAFVELYHVEILSFRYARETSGDQTEREAAVPQEHACARSLPRVPAWPLIHT